MDPLKEQQNAPVDSEQGSESDAERVTSVTWTSDGHEVAEKNKDWYWVLWIIAISLSLAVLIFYEVITAVLILVAAATLTLLARSEQTSQTCTVDADGIRVDQLFYPYTSFRGYEIILRDEVEPLLILSTNAMLNPHLFIHIPDEVSIDALAELLDQFMPMLEEGLPLSHRIVEYLGL
jgi:hypothetical protein